MKKEKFEEKLKRNNFNLDTTHSNEDLGLKLYHNKELKYPIFLINKFDPESKEEKTIIINGKYQTKTIPDLIIDWILNFKESISYDKKTTAVIYNFGDTDEQEMFTDGYFFMKVPARLSEYIILKDTEKQLDFTIYLEEPKDDIDLLISPYKDVLEILFDILKMVSTNKKDKYHIGVPKALAQSTMYIKYYLSESFKIN